MRAGTYAVSRLLGSFLKSKEALPQMGSVKTKERVFILTKKGFTVWDDKSFLFNQTIYTLSVAGFGSVVQFQSLLRHPWVEFATKS